jgi:hypothetical protein
MKISFFITGQSLAYEFSLIYSRLILSMKRFLNIIIIAGLLVTGIVTSTHAQNKGKGKAQRTSGAAAAYGNSVPFKSHVKKNKQNKRKAMKSAKKKKLRDSREPYRRGIPI